jgi:NADP-dependent 3-hydroxy acid dehydrogenase YdfG
MKTAFITGATSGIGKACATLLAQKGWRLILTGRRADRLQAIQQDLGNITQVQTLCYDVRDRNATQAAIQTLSAEWQNIDVLLNNAGNAHGLDLIQEGSYKDWDAMIDINVKGLLYTTEAILPFMLKQKSGHIINIGSIAGKEVYAKGAVYCASKSAVHSLTEGMRIDLNAEGIKVSMVNPGLVETEFSLVRFKGDAKRAAQVYRNMQPLSAEDVANVIAWVIEAPKHVNIAETLLLPLAQASATIVHREE